MNHALNIFLTAILHLGLRNDFFFISTNLLFSNLYLDFFSFLFGPFFFHFPFLFGLFFPFSFWTFIPLFSFSFISSSKFFFNSFIRSWLHMGFLQFFFNKLRQDGATVRKHLICFSNVDMPTTLMLPGVSREAKLSSF